MEIFYNISGSERKLLVAAISKELIIPTKYLGAPTFAYQVGDYHIDKNGLLEGPDNPGLVTDLQVLYNFNPVSFEFDVPMSSDKTMCGNSKESPIDLQDANDIQSSDCNRNESEPEEMNILTIEMPISGFTDESITNLEKMIASKDGLIRRALGADTLSIERTETALQFPWFSSGISNDEFDAYARFIAALCAAAKKQRRVTAKEKQVENEKFAFRVFLIRLGFVGEDYKAARKILLRNLSGNSAFKTVPIADEEADVHE